MTLDEKVASAMKTLTEEQVVALQSEFHLPRPTAEAVQARDDKVKLAWLERAEKMKPKEKP